MDISCISDGDPAAGTTGTTGTTEGAGEGDVGRGGAANKAAGDTATTADGLDVEGCGVIAGAGDGAVFDVERNKITVATVTTAGTNANVDVDVTALNVIDVVDNSAAATADGLSHQSDGVVAGGADDEVVGIQADRTAVATTTASSGDIGRKATECGIGGTVRSFVVDGTGLTTATTNGLEQDAFG